MRSAYSYFYFSKKQKWLYLTKLKFGYIYYLKKRWNLVDGTWEDYGIESFENILEKRKINQFTDLPIVTHFFYELGSYWLNEKVTQASILAIDLEYQEHDWKDVYSDDVDKKENNFKIDFRLIKSPNFEDYKKNIEQIIFEIRLGKYYQCNYTDSYVYKTNGAKVDFEKIFLRKKSMLSGHAQYSYIPFPDPRDDRCYFSNSPETLFVIKKNELNYELQSIPIKGTVKLKDFGNDIALAKYDLKNCSKNQAELFMIADLVRNDLNKIEDGLAKIVKKKMFFKVPLILHQASLITLKLSGENNLLKIMKALFPGGSITGAPKKSSFMHLKKLEKMRWRGFYCGSTLLHFKEIKSCSINIRTLEYFPRKNRCTFYAGGGITMLSKAKEEYREMELKQLSLIGLWRRDTK